MFYAEIDLMFSILFPNLFLVVLGMILYTIIGNISTFQVMTPIHFSSLLAALNTASTSLEELAVPLYKIGRASCRERVCKQV